MSDLNKTNDYMEKKWGMKLLYNVLCNELQDIRRDRTAHQYDGRTEFEIPAQNIICIHEVEDKFPDIDRWLFD